MISLDNCLYSQENVEKECVKKIIKYDLGFALSSMVQKLGKEEPQVKKTSC